MSATPIHQSPSTWAAPSSPFSLQPLDFPFIDQLFHKRTVQGRRGETLPLDVYIPPLQGELLYSLVSYLKPTATLEVGLANGISALYISQALNDNGHGTHLAIDPFQSRDWCDAGLVALERAGLDRHVTLDTRPSHLALPDLERNGRRIQFAFVDGSHQFDYVMTDFFGIDRILDVGGLIAFDDSDWPAITKVIRFILKNRDYDIFDTGTIIEPSPIQPRLASRLVRALARRVPALQRLFQSSFIWPSHELGILGRCVILRKRGDDKRESQSQDLVDF